jgi:hypothetical protein
MEKHPLVSQEGYDPNRLLDALIQKLGLKNDAALSRALEVRPPVISKIRHRTLPVGASLLIRMHEVTDLSIRELRELMSTASQENLTTTISERVRRRFKDSTSEIRADHGQ